MLGALQLLDPEVNNTGDGLCSFKIKDDPILKEGEISYLWSRQMAVENRQLYFTHKQDP